MLILGVLDELSRGNKATDFFSHLCCMQTMPRKGVKLFIDPNSVIALPTLAASKGSDSLDYRSIWVSSLDVPIA